MGGFSRDSDDRLSLKFHKFVDLYVSCDTRSVGLGQHCLPKVSNGFKSRGKEAISILSNSSMRPGIIPVRSNAAVESVLSSSLENITLHSYRGRVSCSDELPSGCAVRALLRRVTLWLCCQSILYQPPNACKHKPSVSCSPSPFSMFY